MTEKRITRIPAVPPLPKRVRTAAYARVSSGKDAMLHSLSVQVSYFSAMIQQNPAWEYVGVYADEAYTGTKSERPEFQRLMADCRAGKIDQVIAKSISRFSRNTVTLLETMRELRLLGVDVYFQKENIHSMDAQGELLLTLLASVAQEESLNVSENCKWRVRSKFAEGTPHGVTMLGYRFRDNQLRIVPEEAEIVRMVHSDYLSGLGRVAIARKLAALGIPTRRGKPWSPSTIFRILHNEAYAGDLLLQKTFVSDHLTKKQRINRGELPMTVVTDSHEATIDPETISLVKDELARRAQRHHPSREAPASYPFTGRITCGICGMHYQRKIANAGTKYAKPVWVCWTKKQHGRHACAAKQIPEDILVAVTAEVLGVDDVDETAITSMVQSIAAHSGNLLRFHLADGRIAERIWRNRSRSEGWDAAARARASEQKKGRVNQ